MGKVVILGVFVADTAYRASRMPKMGETILGNSFALGPGGKGSNQAVAAGKLGADVTIITRLANDDFGKMAMQTWENANVKGAEELTRLQDDFYKLEKEVMDAGSATDEQKETARNMYNEIMKRASEIGLADDIDDYMLQHINSIEKGDPKPGFGRTDVKESLYVNIARKKARIAGGSGEKMRKPGSEGAPKKKDFERAAKTAKS